MDVAMLNQRPARLAPLVPGEGESLNAVLAMVYVRHAKARLYG